MGIVSIFGSFSILQNVYTTVGGGSIAVSLTVTLAVARHNTLFLFSFTTHKYSRGKPNPTHLRSSSLGIPRILTMIFN